MTEEKILPFLDHLTELRKRLIIIIIAVIIGMGLAWNLADEILVFMEKPLSGETYLTEVKNRVYSSLSERYPALTRRAGLGEEHGRPQRKHALNYTAPLEPFFVQCKISALAGFILVLPVVFQQLWLFISPGLTFRERKLVVPFVAAATIAFCVGALFFLVVIWPFIINFSLSYESEGLRSWLSLTSYVNFCLRLILLFGAIFELPVLTLLLTRFGLVTYRFLAPKRKYALLASSIVAAFHSDLVTMFVIMIPLYLMYEISVWVAFIFGPRERVADKEPAETPA